ncbi:ATP-binding protein [Planomicrobium soli]|uniref:ATP-binding protein n=1 Tax=Planomicrobium soli TaxID=1176648 RepID=UPI0015E71C4F|nr:ATP-binding protein [Planomicrobium soli]
MKLIKYEEEEICPLCERERNTELLSQQQSEKIRQAHASKAYLAFSKQSILTDENLYSASFGNYEAKQHEEIANNEKAVKAYQRYKGGEVFNTWLTGMPGVGKSPLAMSILRNLNETGEKDKCCLFISVDEMLRKIRGTFDNRESIYTENYFVDLLSVADHLVLDDLGAETGATGTGKQASDFTLRVLYAIANARQNKPTIITSNLSKGELVKMYDAKLVSRLMKDTYLIKFEETSDKRIKNIEF